MPAVRHDALNREPSVALNLSEVPSHLHMITADFSPHRSPLAELVPLIDCTLSTPHVGAQIEPAAGRWKMRQAMQDLLHNQPGAGEQLSSLVAIGAIADPVDQAFFGRMFLNDVHIGRDGARSRLSCLVDAGVRPAPDDAAHFLTLAVEDAIDSVHGAMVRVRDFVAAGAKLHPGEMRGLHVRALGKVQSRDPDSKNIYAELKQLNLLGEMRGSEFLGLMGVRRKNSIVCRP